MNKIDIDLDIAKKVLATVDAGLVQGVGQPAPGQMCVEAAVCFALGLPHGDNPPCVAPAVRALKIRLNDAAWKGWHGLLQSRKAAKFLHIDPANPSGWEHEGTATRYAAYPATGPTTQSDNMPTDSQPPSDPPVRSTECLADTRGG